jgi:enamine deaminase RidA (YjgF/YER057c/UK114 family)
MRDLGRRAALGAAALLLPCGSPRSQTASAEARLRERGITLPGVQAPVANYVPFVRTGNLVFTAGLGPTRPDGGLITGVVGRDVTLEDAYGHARITGLLLLAVARAAAGSLDAVTRAVHVRGMVNAVPGFTDHPRVINGCTDLFVEVLGDRGRPARAAIGMGSLPFNISVEIEAVFEVA